MERDSDCHTVGQPDSGQTGSSAARTARGLAPLSVFMILETPRRHRHAGLIVKLLFFVAAFGHALGAAETNSTSPEIAPGLAWFHQSIRVVPWSIHVVQIDRGRAGFQFVTSLAQGAVVGLAPLSEQVRSLPTPQGEPLAAINGDFFRIEKGPYQGDPRGLQITQGELVSNPTSGACFWIDAKGRPQTGAVTPQLKVIWPNRRTTPMGLNQECTNNRAVLYTPTFGPSTRTRGGLELVLEPAGNGPWLPLRAGLVYTARVREVRTGGETPWTGGRVVNSPSDGRERPVANALILLRTSAVQQNRNP